jgi:hypothetical protein
LSDKGACARAEQSNLALDFLDVIFAGFKIDLMTPKVSKGEGCTQLSAPGVRDAGCGIYTHV